MPDPTGTATTPGHDASLVIDSIDRHYLVGCGYLNAAQLHQHETELSCSECRARTHLLTRRAAAAAGRDPADGAS